MSYLFVFDFDGCITDWNDELSTHRADRLAYAMNQLLRFGKIEIVSLANRAHIRAIVKQSESQDLIKIFNDIRWSQWNTIEKRNNRADINPSRKESVKKQNAMILNVMKSDQWLMDMDCIMAYKKANALLILSKQYHLRPDQIYFFDDNKYNIIFARHNGFNAEWINNHPAMYEFNLRARLLQVKKILT
jgi:FMN phosphatase YigB (HAD superfamily)